MAETQPTTRKPILGCIADDVTGATDLATNLVQAGMCVVQLLDVPTVEQLREIDADAVVVALKTRSIAAADAIELSLAAMASMREVGMERYFFKYCSTFDSTSDGNIGPVARAMLESLPLGQTVFCPAFPENGRTVYQGHLFVHGQLLNESGMQLHPINPMTDANLMRVLSEQLPEREQVGLLTCDDIEAGEVIAKLATLEQSGHKYVVTDACNDRHLDVLAKAISGLPLVTGGSGIAKYLPAAYRSDGLLTTPRYTATPPNVTGRSLVVSGSCSTATQKQVSYMDGKCESLSLDVESLFQDGANAVLERVASWFESIEADAPGLIYSTSSPDRVAQLQAKHGRMEVATAIEEFLATVTHRLVQDCGVRRLVVAGGETSGAIVNKLCIQSLRIGPDICPGVPWTQSEGDRPLALALKSGNFGDVDFFETALEMLP